MIIQQRIRPELLLVGVDNMTRVIVSRLAEQHQITVTVASTYEAALHMLSRDSFDIVIADTVLVAEGNRELLHAAENQQTPPALLLLADVIEPWHHAVTIDYPATCSCLLKPCLPEEIQAFFADALRHCVSSLPRIDSVATLVRRELHEHVQCQRELPGEHSGCQVQKQLDRGLTEVV